MPNHTPGPWGIDGYDINAPWGCVAVVCEAGADDCEGEANARLISAAPALLTALQALTDAVDAYTPDPEDWPELAAARAAIKQATGE